MDIFRSKEVYRKIRKRESGDTNNPIIPIRGMYVVGQYLIPEYKSDGLVITNIYSVYPTIVDYTEKSESMQSDHITRFLNLHMEKDKINVTRYSLQTAPSQTDHITKFLKLQMEKSFSYVRYSRLYDTRPSDHITKFIGLKMEKDNLTLKKYYQPKMSSQPEPILLIRDIRTGELEIQDI